MKSKLDSNRVKNSKCRGISPSRRPADAQNINEAAILAAAQIAHKRQRIIVALHKQERPALPLPLK